MNFVDRSTPGSPVGIEPATWRDLNALRSLEHVCFPEDAWPLWDLIGVLSFPNVIRLKAVVDGQMVGFVAADIRRSEKVAWIATVGVLPDYRSRGIGGALLQAIEAQLVSSPANSDLLHMRLSVRPSNETAIRLYERMGYQRAGTWGHYYADGEDALVLEKLF